MTALVDEAAALVNKAISPPDYRALVIIGGYGRGEGGVEIVDGDDRPHNNLDFLLIAETLRPKKLQALRESLMRALLPVMQQYEIEIDISVVSIWKLRMSPSLIIWYDMRFGHKTILGDANYVSALSRFRVDQIPTRDAIRLLVNRGTLLLINDQLLDQGNESIESRRRIIRNNMKAVIGYGDALLFFLGQYHWSYVERQSRMRSCDDVPKAFRSLYDEAAEFRLQPNYAHYQSRDLRACSTDLRNALEPIHRMCEIRRLGAAELQWDKYLDLVLRHAFSDEPLSARAWVRKGLHLTRRTNCSQELSARARLGCKVMGTKDRSQLVFPLLAYHLKEPKLQAFAAATLNVPPESSIETLREAYIRLWCEEIDINSLSDLRAWHVPVAQKNDKQCSSSS